MPVLINFKICDNAKECNGIEVCPTGALSWDDEKNSIKIDNKKCISCGKCEKACMVNAIFVAGNKDEYQRAKKEIGDDKRKVSDLFVDRYGAQPIHTAFLITEGKFPLEVLESEKTVAVEMFDDDSIMCLLKSVPMSEILRGYSIKYRKMPTSKKMAGKFKVKKFPALLFFQKGKLLGKIEGYYSDKQKEALRKKADVILKK